MNRHELKIKIDQLNKERKELDERRAALESKMAYAKNECYVVTYFNSFNNRKVFDCFYAFTQSVANSFCDNFDKERAEHNYNRSLIFHDLDVAEDFVYKMDSANWTSNTLALIGNPTYARIKFEGED